MSKKITTEEYNKQIKSIGWEAIEEYQGVSVKIKHRCLKCHNVREYQPNSIYKHHPKCCCSGGLFNHQEKVRYLQKWAEENDHILIDVQAYNRNTYIYFVCKNHLKEGVMKKTWNAIYTKKEKCKYCSGAKVSKKEAETIFRENLKENEEFLYCKRDSFGNKNRKYWFGFFKCKKHNIIFREPIHQHKKGIGCPCCGNEKSNNFNTLSDEEIKSQIKDKISDKYKIIKFFRKNDKIKCVLNCPVHGNFVKNKSSIDKGFSSCPKCNSSKGENRVRLILEKYNIDFIEQYKIEDCKYKQSLPFDFYIPEQNILIEYDGEQHFEPARFAKNKGDNIKKFKEVQRNDEIKNKYCKDNNIKLIRIPYTEYDNIEEIFKKELSI